VASGEGQITARLGAVLDLPAAEVPVWWARPHLDPTWPALLDATEAGRLASYRREEDRARFFTGTMRVRSIYASDLGVAPADVKLDRTCPDCDRPHGKVRLAGGGSDIEVSVSHSGDWVVVAAYRGRSIGVDVEEVNHGLDHLSLAALAMTDAETARLRDELDRAGTFTTLWARKEAVVKALGEGLRTPLNGFAVSPDGRIEEWPERPDLVGRVHLLDLDADAAHRAAVAVLDERPARVVRR
jgi:4'-phosphopantetheinyl transferase